MACPPYAVELIGKYDSHVTAGPSSIAIEAD